MLPAKATSPALSLSYGGKTFRAIVDSGAELNCINLQLARDMRIPFQKTSTGARVPGDTAIELAGVTTSDLVLSADFNGRTVPVHLGNAVVVDSLGSDLAAINIQRGDHTAITMSHTLGAENQASSTMSQTH